MVCLLLFIPDMARSFLTKNPGSKLVLVLDCRGEAHPVICFALDVAGCRFQVVADEHEAFNLFSNAQQTGEQLACLVVNNPQQELDITRVLDQMPKLRTQVPILFVKQCDQIVPRVEEIVRQRGLLAISACEPNRLINEIYRLAADQPTSQETAPPGAGGRRDEKNTYGG